jgi:predicted small secreted protein
MNKPILFMVVAYVFLTGCATVDGIREDVAKPFTAVGKVGDWIKPCKETAKEKCKKDDE